MVVYCTFIIKVTYDYSYAWLLLSTVYIQIFRQDIILTVLTNVLLVFRFVFLTKTKTPMPCAS